MVETLLGKLYTYSKYIESFFVTIKTIYCVGCVICFEYAFVDYF